MQCDTERERVASLTEATRRVPPLNGRRPSIAAVWRWCRKGPQVSECHRVGTGLCSLRLSALLLHCSLL